MFIRSHLEEMKRRYASIYAPPVEKEVTEDGTIEGVNQYKKDTPGQGEEVEEHCGVCGEQGIKEDEIEEGFQLQATMALDDEGIKSKWKKGKLYVAKRDIKKAEKALGKSFKKMKKGAEPDLYYEEVEIDEADKKYPPTIETLKMIVKDKQNQVLKFKDGNARVDMFSASAMTQVYDAMKKPELKKNFEKMIGTKAGFLKIQAFAFSMVK